jgi:hypothetical protein
VITKKNSSAKDLFSPCSSSMSFCSSFSFSQCPQWHVGRRHQCISGATDPQRSNTNAPTLGSIPARSAAVGQTPPTTRPFVLRCCFWTHWTTPNWRTFERKKRNTKQSETIQFSLDARIHESYPGTQQDKSMGCRENRFVVGVPLGVFDLKVVAVAAAFLFLLAVRGQSRVQPLRIQMQHHVVVGF